MARLLLDPPETVLFRTELPVRIDDVNFGGHLGHDAVVTLLHEARARFFASRGRAELDVDGLGRIGIIMADLAVVYRSEAHYGDVLGVEIGLADFWERGVDVLYLVRSTSDGREVARAKTGLVFFDYQDKKTVPVPADFASRFAGS